MIVYPGTARAGKQPMFYPGKHVRRGGLLGFPRHGGVDVFYCFAENANHFAASPCACYFRPSPAGSSGVLKTALARWGASCRALSRSVSAF